MICWYLINIWFIHNKNFLKKYLKKFYSFYDYENNIQIQKYNYKVLFV